MPKSSTTLAKPPQIKAAQLRTFHARLQDWYATHGRHDLPWRNTPDPYHIWLSEVMLQQTQVATVLARFYHPFLATFPTVQSLAEAPRDQVMKAWEGLGYYRRAGYLHKAAQQLHQEGHGTLPRSVDELGALPGIGRNTAHAIAAFAYHQPVAILEANVKRIVARIFAWPAPSERDLWAGATVLLNAAEPFHHNQAMMDLGSIICTPKRPACPICPARNLCEGQIAPEQFPTPRTKKRPPIRSVTILVQRDDAGKLYLERRSDALLGGLYGFPQMPAVPPSQAPLPAVSWGTDSQALGTVTHTYSHFKLIGQVLVQPVAGHKNAPNWFSVSEIAALPLSGVDHKVLVLVAQSHTGKKQPLKADRKTIAR